MIFRTFIIAALAAVLWISPANAAITPGQKAPALVVTDLQGHKFDLQAQQGKTVVVTLWASWCPPCLEEIPVLNDFYRKYHSKGIEVLALSLDRPQDRDAMKKTAAKMAYPAAMSSDASANDFDTAGSLPVTYVIDAKGNVSAVFDEEPVTERELVKGVFK